MNNEHFLAEMEGLYMALADKTRLRLLNLMREEEICVCFFTEVLGESQPKISRHLAYLRNAGLVSARREGKWMHYQIVPPENPYLADVLEATLNALKAQDDMREDHENLVNICCSAEVPVTIARAPKPDTFVETNVVEEPNFQKTELETFLL